MNIPTPTLQDAPQFQAEHDRRNKAIASALGAAGAGAGVGSAFISKPAHADPLADLNTGVTTIATMWETAAAIAVGVIVFSAGAAIVNRVIRA